MYWVASVSPAVLAGHEQVGEGLGGVLGDEAVA
jgi:hypothetical protein